MGKGNISFGRCGEESALSFLRDNGYKIIARNYKVKSGEVDIIACDNDTVCFIEVKARRSGRFGSPQEAVGRLKQLRIARASLQFLKEKKLLDKKARFDVVSLEYGEGAPKPHIIKNAFELDERFLY